MIKFLNQYADYGTVAQIRNTKISAHVSMYNSNPLVNKVYDQSIIPVSVLHVDTLNKARLDSISRLTRSDTLAL